MCEICLGRLSCLATKYVQAAETPAIDLPVTKPSVDNFLYMRATSSCNGRGKPDLSLMN